PSSSDSQPLLPSAARCHCALHSFPTRRSSDLISTASPLCSTAASCSSKSDINGTTINVGITKMIVIKLDKNKMVDAFHDDGDLLDRKSTRLNSSHVSISYAVFCLKKKTNNIQI